MICSALYAGSATRIFGVSAAALIKPSFILTSMPQRRKSVYRSLICFRSSTLN